MIDVCPLCKKDLNKFFYETHANVSCKQCCIDNMAKFQANYTPDGKTLTSTTWWLDGDYYLQVNYEENVTKLCRVDGCILMDAIYFNHAIEVDFNDPQKTAQRLDNLMVFS